MVVIKVHIERILINTQPNFLSQILKEQPNITYNSNAEDNALVYGTWLQIAENFMLKQVKT